MFDWYCEKCGKIVKCRRVHRRLPSGLYVSYPEPSEPSEAEYKRFEEPLSDDEMINIILKAWNQVKKYRDGERTKDTWLAAEIYRCMDFRHAENWKELPWMIVEYAIERGWLKVVKEVNYAIPYAYRKHRGFRGIKGFVSWRV